MCHNQLRIDQDQHPGAEHWMMVDIQNMQAMPLFPVWEVWRHCNSCVFEGVLPDIQVLLLTISEEGTLWCMAGATNRQDLLAQSLSPAP